MTSEPPATPDTQDTPATPATKHLFVLGFPDRAGADRAVAGLRSLERDRFLEVRDHAILTKDADGKLHVDENKEAGHGTGHGLVTGGLAGAFVAVLAGPIGIGAVVAGAGIGAVANALTGAGFKHGDLDEVGRLMEGGRTLLLVAVRPGDADRLRDAIGDLPELTAADRRWEATVSGDSSNVLRDAIAQWREEHQPTPPD